jgi:hypothetical protein
MTAPSHQMSENGRTAITRDERRRILGQAGRRGTSCVLSWPGTTARSGAGELPKLNALSSQWVDGCEGGESAEEMSARCDSVIERIVDITK